jgi:GcrA cell cycle regulator
VPNQYHLTWTKIPVLTAELDRCIEAKLSARQTAVSISDMGGILVSRNAVLGYAFRIHKNFQNQVHSGGGSTKGQKRVRKKHLKNGHTNLRPEPRRPSAISEEEGLSFDLSIPQNQRRSLLELEDGMCRWPIGDTRVPGMFFCGGESVDGSSYCEHHHLRATTHSHYNDNSRFLLRQRGRVVAMSRGMDDRLD